MNSKSIAVVTGGAGDIGRAIASRLSQTHDIVFLVDIDHGKLLMAQQELQSGSSHEKKYMICGCDITKDEEVASMASTVSSHGNVRTLINNAGATRVGSLGELTPATWREDTSLNLDASFFCFHAFEEDLKKTRGSVVNIASVSGLGVFGNPAYSAAKAGLIHFTKSIAVEYGKFGLRSNCVAPGTVRTGAWKEKAAANPEVFEQAMKWYPLQRRIEPEDIASAVAFLTNDDMAGAITGICMPVDSGLMAGQTALAKAFGQSDNY
jgi:NAD(P)-dependent dehydrogenase (short-subunit alcohol dehydrogenase family)